MSAPPGPPPPWPPYYPPPAKLERRWLPVAIIVAAIILATAMIVAVLLSRGPNNLPPVAGSIGGQSPSALNDAGLGSSTCNAWPSSKAALNAIPALPEGWNWDTPKIDMYIADQNAAVSRALDLFELEIGATDTPLVVDAAKSYISERRAASKLLSERTFTTADGVSVTAARAKLDQVCGVS